MTQPSLRSREPRYRVGPGLRVRCNAAMKRKLLAKARRLRKNRHAFLFWAIMHGALSRREIDEAGL